MRGTGRFVLAALLVCLAASLSAGGGRENGDKGERVRVSGKVRLVGTGLFPELVVTSAEREWYIERDEHHKLKDLQQRTVTVEGYETVKEMNYANGLPAGERRTLKEVKVITVR